MVEVLGLIAAVIGVAVAVAAAIFTYRSFRGDVDSRKTEAEQKTIGLRAPNDADDLAKCVAALKGGLQTLEPFISRQEVSQLLESPEFPSRLVLIGPPGVGKSRVAVEAVRRLQRDTPARAIYIWDRFLPAEGGLLHFNAHKPILMIDDLQPGTGRNFGKHLDAVLDRLSTESGRDRNAANVIVTIWPAHQEWLKRQLADRAEFTFVELKKQDEDEARQYALNLTQESFFPSVKLSAEALSQLAFCGSYGEVFSCVRYFFNHSILSPSREQVEAARLRSWADELNSFAPSEKLLINILTVLHQFQLPKDWATINALYTASLRGEIGGRFNCGSARYPFPAKLRRSARRLFLRSNKLCELECREAVRALEKKRYVRAADVVTSDRQDVLAREPNHVDYNAELMEVIKVIKSRCRESRVAMAKRHWVPLLVQTGELLYKQGLFQQAIDLNEWLLGIDPKRLHRPANQARSEFLHYIGFNHRNLSPFPEAAAKATEYYRRALETDPKNVKAKHSLANYLYRDAHEYSKAIELFQEIVREKPDDWLTHKTLIELYLNGLVAWDAIQDSYLVLNELWESGRAGSMEVSIGTVLGRIAAARFTEERNSMNETEIPGAIERVREIFRRAIAHSTEAKAAPPHYFYGEFLYEQAREADEGIEEIERALASLRKSYILKTRTGKSFNSTILYKLASCYEMQADLRPLEAPRFEKKLNDLLDNERLAKFDGARYFLYEALRASMRVKWASVPESIFWEEMQRVLQQFSAALARGCETGDLLHNARVHREVAGFTWRLERIAKRRSFGKEKAEGSSTIEAQLKASIGSAEQIVPDDYGPKNSEIAKAAYLLAVYYSLNEQYENANVFLKRAEEANQKWRQEGHADGQGLVWFRGSGIDPRVMIAKLLVLTGDPERAAGLLLEQLRCHPEDPVASWFLGRAYEAMYRLEESFSAFWKAAEQYKVPTYFSQLRIIVDEWRDPRLEGRQGALAFHVPGLRPSSRAGGYRFRILERDLPDSRAMQRLGTSGERQQLIEFFAHCAALKEALAKAGWNSDYIDGVMLRCSRRAFDLDPNGKKSLKNITDFADDLLQAGQIPEARNLFEYAVRRDDRDCFSIWRIGECLAKGQGRVTLESAGYYLRSAALEGTANVAKQLSNKLIKFAGDTEQITNLFLDNFEQYPETISMQLINVLMTSSIDPAVGGPERQSLSSPLLDRILAFERTHPTREARALAAVVLQRYGNNEQALRYFERLGEVEYLPNFVLASCAACLRGLNDARSEWIDEILKERQTLRQAARV
jgi:tetratricopeptide (TPR) repeat protein